jgi:ABC-2 type transport system ATP-binding protein
MIRVDALTRRYGDFNAVDQVSFTIGQGEIVGLLGHNGAGKTTIMKMLTGHLEPTAGHIEVDHQSILDDRQAAQRQIGYLPESDPLYPDMSVMDYLAYAAELHGIAPDVRDEKIRTAIHKTALQDKATQLISTLSRGYRQRVGVAQAILHNPRLLILDEPTNGLDPTQVQQMRELIRALAQQATVILSTHILQEVQVICDRVIIIRDGRKALDSSMAELRAGGRLLVEAGEDISGLMPQTPGVQSVRSLGERRYALELDDQQDIQQIASQVAQDIVGAGIKLYALQHERRDLETVFNEISAR